MRFVPLALLLSLSPLPLMAHDGHGAAALGVTVEELANASQQWDGQPLPDYPRGRPLLKVLRIGIPSGVVLPWHTHPVINAAVILRGTLALNLKDGTTKVFRTGEAIVEVIDTVHTGQAIGAEDVEVVVFYAGVEGVPTTVLQQPAAQR
jgi:quercetin dioxygenase-like cupin family protein